MEGEETAGADAISSSPARAHPSSASVASLSPVSLPRPRTPVDNPTDMDGATPFVAGEGKCGAVDGGGGVGGQRAGSVQNSRAGAGARAVAGAGVAGVGLGVISKGADKASIDKASIDKASIHKASIDKAPIHKPCVVVPDPRDPPDEPSLPPLGELSTRGQGDPGDAGGVAIAGTGSTHSGMLADGQEGWQTEGAAPARVDSGQCFSMSRTYWRGGVCVCVGVRGWC